MRAHDGALAAVDAQVGRPDRDLHRDGALLPLGGRRGERAIGRQGTHRQQVALPREHARRDALHEVGCLGGHRRPAVTGGRDRATEGEFVQMGQRLVDGGDVAFHHHVAARAVRVLDGALQFTQRLLLR